jgi:hypothetical protein
LVRRERDGRNMEQKEKDGKGKENAERWVRRGGKEDVRSRKKRRTRDDPGRKEEGKGRRK